MKSPGKSAVATAVIWALLLSGTVTLLVSHRDYVVHDPLILVWIALSFAVGFGLFFANLAGIRLHGSVLALLGYGAFATIGAFALQSLVNGSLSTALGESGPSFLGALALGFGSGFCQTLGKGVAIGLLIWKLQPRGLCEILEIGLAVGLGFGLAEVLLIADQIVVQERAITSLLGVVERASAQGFHIYSGALIAVGIGFRKWWPIAFVLVFHTLLDGLAGGLVKGIPILGLEGVFAGIALATWVCYLAVKDGAERSSGVQ